MAFSGRALAASARRAHIPARVSDLFGDLDTRSLCEAYALVRSQGQSFDFNSLRQAADELDPEQCLGVLYGGGFEAEPGQLAALNRPLFGNSPELVSALKDPVACSALLARLGIPQPEIRLDPPLQPGGWLAKRRGGAGGSHVRSAAKVEHDPNVYYQRYIPGRVCSVTLLGNGRDVHSLGFCEQWCDATLPDRPFVYGGAVTLSPSNFATSLKRELQDAAYALVAATGLRGLCGFDFIVDDDGWWLIDINPRPSATFELHEHNVSLVFLHLQAVRGHLPSVVPDTGATIRAHAIVYAYNRITIPAAYNWPFWISDRPCPATIIDRGEPVCTVHAAASSSDAVHIQLKTRHQQILEMLSLWQTPSV